MIPLGLSHADRRAFEATLTRTHRIRVIVRIHDHDEKVTSTVTNRLLSGSVEVNMAQSPHRILNLVLLEPRRSPTWLPDGPGDASVFADNFISVLYSIYVDDLSDGPGWVDVPVFWGPVTGMSQDGDQITIAAAGKETLGIDPCLLWNTMQVHKGQTRVKAIRDILAAQGEARFDLPDLPAKIGKKMSLNRHAQPWHVAKSIAGGSNWQLFYDGRGRARVRRWPQNRVVTFHGGPGGTVLTKPRISYDVSSVRNLVEVLGPEPKGPPKRIRAVARAKAKHKMSAYQMRRNGQPRNLVHVVDSNLAKPEMEWHKTAGGNEPGGPPTHGGWWGAPSGIKHPHRWQAWRHTVIVHRKKHAQEIADRQLKNRLKATVEASFDCLPWPHAEEGDPAAVYTDGMHFEFILKQFTLPLTADAPMSIGVNKRVSWRGKKTKHKTKRLR
jgi:YD repeat-containing protein